MILDGMYGSRTFPPNSECSRCHTRAIGVLVKDRRHGGMEFEDGEPLCGNHRDMIKLAEERRWEQDDWRRFVD